MGGAIVVSKNSASNLKLTYHHTNHMSVTGGPWQAELAASGHPIDKMSVNSRWQASSSTERTVLARKRQGVGRLFFEKRCVQWT